MNYRDRIENGLLWLPIAAGAVLILVFSSAGCASSPQYETVITVKQAYTLTAREVASLGRQGHFNADEARAIKAIDDEAHAAVKLLVRKFLAGEPVTGSDALRTLRSALVRLARYQYEGEARRAQATTRPVVRVPVDEGPLPPKPPHVWTASN
jgi:hypothetical protein